MRSKVFLYNMALARLGGEQLDPNISPLEKSNTGRICENVFPHVLEFALSSSDWSFAIYRKELASPVLPKETAPNPAYPFVFELPTDCIKPLRLQGYAGVNRTPVYVIEGRTIRTVIGNAVLVYIARVTDPMLWPPKFADALAWRLAGELASAVNNDPQKQLMCYDAYDKALAAAIVQDRTDQNFRRDRSKWTAARFGEGDY